MTRDDAHAIIGIINNKQVAEAHGSKKSVDALERRVRLHRHGRRVAIGSQIHPHVPLKRRQHDGARIGKARVEGVEDLRANRWVASSVVRILSRGENCIAQ